MSERKRKRCSIDLATKVKIIEKYEGGQTVSSISHELNFASSTVSTIIKNAVRIQEAAKDSSTLSTTVISKLREGGINQMEKQLSAWMEQQSDQCLPLTKAAIQAKAISIFQSLQPGYPKQSSFSASNGWFNRFKARFGLHMAHAHRDARQQSEWVSKHIDWLKTVLRDGDYVPEQVFSIEQTNLFYRRTVKRDLLLHSGSHNRRVQLLLCGNATGTIRLKPFLIHTSPNPKGLRHIVKATLPLHFRWNQKGKLSLMLLQDWFVKCFVPEAEAQCKSHGLPFRLLLLLHNSFGRAISLDDLCPQVRVLYFPVTSSPSLLHSTSQSILLGFIADYTSRMLVQALDAMDDDPSVTFDHFFRHQYSLYDAIKHIAAAWTDLGQQHTALIWVKLTPNLKQWSLGNEQDHLQAQVERLLQVLKPLQSHDQVGYDEVLELLLCHNQQQVCRDELLQLANDAGAADSSAEDDADGDDWGGDDDDDDHHHHHHPEAQLLTGGSPRRFTAVGMKEAVRCLTRLFRLMESQDPDMSRFLLFQSRVNEAFAFYRQVYRQKTEQQQQQQPQSECHPDLQGPP